MTLQEIARIKAMAVAPCADPWVFRGIICRLAVELEDLMIAHAALRERACVETRVPESRPNVGFRALPLSPWHGARPPTSEDCAA